MPLSKEALQWQSKLINKKSDISTWLYKMKIKNFTINTDLKYGWTIDVVGNVNLSGLNLEYIPVKFNNIHHGYFSIDKNNLKSLLGCPDSVGGNFCANYNALTSLEGAPSKVWLDFEVSNNYLTNLIGAPDKCLETFDCSNNMLLSLEGICETIDCHLKAQNNQIQHLHWFPKFVGQTTFLSGNKNPALIDFSFFEDAKSYRKADLERCMIDNGLPKEKALKNFKETYKI